MKAFEYTVTDDPLNAKVVIDTAAVSEHSIPRYLTGKFTEHLGNNIYHGLDAQILHNPTFGDWPFAAGGHPDGGIQRTGDPDKIAAAIRHGAERLQWPAIEGLLEAREDGLAHWWIREGAREDVVVSTEPGPTGERGQRIETTGIGQGIAQWIHLPLHRVRSYQWRLVVRSPNLGKLNLCLFGESAAPLLTVDVDGIGDDWRTLSGGFELPAACAPGGIYRFALVTPKAGQFVIDRILLYPADHVNFADPDTIRFFRESKLPLMRWPGGNFVSGYHWRDGVGPVDERPTRPNPAWATLEPNLFGTAEFIQYCREVGCDPMICVNAGNGTPAEAAAWVEYCNGSTDTPMGKLRAAHGFEEPFDVKLWEIGNELYGRWQVGWTTPAGYSDRYRRFAAAMRRVDPGITLLANGAPLFWGSRDGRFEFWPDRPDADWNRRLCRENAETVQWLTDHLLEGHQPACSTDPIDVYRDYMFLPIVFENCYVQCEKIMRDAGVAEPRLAVTELQLFPRIAARREGEEERLTRENLVTPATMAEAIHVTLVYHLAARLQPFIGIITHSATVNHGGGLRKQNERVWANPVYYARRMFHNFTGAALCPVDISCAEEETATLCSRRPAGTKIPVLDVIAARTDTGDLLVSLVHRGTRGPINVKLELPGCRKAARVTRLAAELPWRRNTLENPELIVPTCSTAPVHEGKLEIQLPLYSITQLRING